MTTREIELAVQLEHAKRTLKRLELPRAERVGLAATVVLLCAGLLSSCVLVKWFWSAL
jgi:hypothetical protein